MGLLRRTLALAGCVLSAAIAWPAVAQSIAEIGGLRFIGAVTVQNDKTVDDTLVGGLSGIDYDPASKVWYLISDDKSDNSPARFYVAKLAFDNGRLSSVAIEHAVTLLQADGKPYPDKKAGGEVPDPESIRRDPETGNLWWTSEGDPNLRLSPFLRIASPDGKYVDAVSMPDMFRADQGPGTGPHRNYAFEGLSFAPDGKSAWVAMESALIQDGPLATPEAGTTTRLTHLDRSGKVLGQFAYPLDPIQGTPAGKGGGDNGISEFLALDDTHALVLERSGVEGADGKWTVYVRVYAIDTAGATDIADVPSLKGAKFQPVSKRLVINLADTPGLGTIDNIEGISWGPLLPDGKRSLVLVSDNNFNPAQQVTQFLAFEVTP